MAFKDLVGKVSTKTETGSETPSPPPPPRPEAPPTARHSAPIALLDASVEFKGTIRCRESIRIDGRCEGELRSDHAVIIGPPAVLKMSIQADSVVVAGQVNGDITATTKITLEPTARVTGNLCTPGIVIQEGAKLEGRIVIDSELDSTGKAEAKPTQAASPAAPKSPEKPAPNVAPPTS